MNGLNLSRDYFFGAARPKLQRDFPGLYDRLAAGLAGNGSECFGYDDEISRDHDWGADFFLWVTEADRAYIHDLLSWKAGLLEQTPPEFTRMPSEYGARIGVMTPGDFYKQLIGYPEGPNSLLDWLRIPEENLAMAVNGEVFMDNAGEFTKTRDYLLGYYPEDIRKKKLAAKCMAIAQTGQYNFHRTVKRGDWVTVRTVLSRFTDGVVSAVFLLNRVYKPYYKWAYRKMTEQPILGYKAGVLLEKLSVSCGTDTQTIGEQESVISDLCALLADELRHQGLAQSDDWFLTTQGEEIQQSIRDDFLRALPAQYE
jgi:hypothetical protein